MTGTNRLPVLVTENGVEDLMPDIPIEADEIESLMRARRPMTKSSRRR